jgi:VWFA-related protein
MKPPARRAARIVGTPSFAAAVFAAAAAASQERGPAASNTLDEFVEVQLVNVEVWVSRDGEPVEGLVADDFEVREDGKPVRVTHFAEVRGSAWDTRRRRARSEPGELAPRPPARAEAGHLVIYLDELHLSAASRKRPLEDLRALVRSEAVDPERVLVLSQAQDLYTAAPFGSTADELDRALERIGSAPGLATSAAGDKRLALQRLQQMWQEAQQNARGGAPCDVFVRRAVSEVELHSRENARRAALTLEHLSGAVRFLAALEGVKTLIFLGDALETHPGADLLRFVEGLCPLADRQERWGEVPEDLGVKLHELTRHANANRVTIHSLQTGGLQPGFIGMAEQTSFDFRGGNPFELGRRATERAGLEMLAEETGGRAVFDQARFGDDLEAIAREMSSYYTLAYEPTHGGDGLLHEIDVAVRGGRYRVRHRRGYRDKDADQRLVERLEGALYLGLVDNPLAVRLAAGSLREGEKGRHALPLHVLVPAERVAFLPGANGAAARLQLVVAVRNHDRPGLETTRRTVEVAKAEPSTDTIALSVELELASGVSVLAVAVRDETTREASFVSTTVAVPEPEAARAPGG